MVTFLAYDSRDNLVLRMQNLTPATALKISADSGPYFLSIGWAFRVEPQK